MPSAGTAEYDVDETSRFGAYERHIFSTPRGLKRTHAMASLVDVHTKFAYNRKRLNRVMMANEEAGTRENPLYMSEFDF